MIDLEKMAKEHEKLFPKATLESQVWKLEEEIKEWHCAKPEHELEEVADIFIVCGGLYRWAELTAVSIINWYLRLYSFKYSDSVIDDEVAYKWEINKQRKWRWNGKTYHHVD